MPSPLEEVTSTRRKTKALIIVIVIFRDWLSIQLRFELGISVPDKQFGILGRNRKWPNSEYSFSLLESIYFSMDLTICQSHLESWRV